MVDSNWSVAADRIKEGWAVSRYSQDGGRSLGKVSGAASLSGKALRVPVAWEFQDSTVDQVLNEPSWRRSLRRSDGSVVISSTDSVLVFEPVEED
jgi:hypothetical protein